ncbi:hypothetical protein ACGFZA_15865 [Streptomyces sp. NPDC048211]|uniref:hypothetical protein n=1 Tax=Streptomyces sp. NPDC048211 TaxID=3365516 RepID=UPI0037181FAB
MSPRSTPVFSYARCDCTPCSYRHGPPVRRFYMNRTELGEEAWRYLARIFGVAVAR